MRCVGAVVAGAVAAAVIVSPTAEARQQPGCGGWHVETIAAGLREVENLEPDGRGGFYLSAPMSVEHIDAAGVRRTVVPNVAAPGGLQLHDGVLSFLTRQDGKLQHLDIASGRLSPPVDFAGNGLLRLPNGDFLTTWVGTEGGPSKGVSRYSRTTGSVEPNWAPVPRAEGLALSPDRTAVYTDDLFTGDIYRIPLDDPQHWTSVARVPGLLPGLDDLTAAHDGTVYAAAHTGGAIHRIDPTTGVNCVVAGGLSLGWTGPSSVRIAPDGDRFALYATLFDGTLRRLRPPADVTLEPVTT